MGASPCPFWKDIQARAAAADVRVAIEMHPGNIVFNPRTMHRLVEEIGATHVGAEMDPSHLFWQGIDPVLAVERPRRRSSSSPPPRTRRINEAAKVNGVLDDRLQPGRRGRAAATSPSAAAHAERLAEDPSWDFVAVGRGHDIDFWTRFLAACTRSTPTCR